MPYTTYVSLVDYQGRQLAPVRLHPISGPRVVGQQGTTLPQSAIPPYGQLFPPTRWFTDTVVPPIVYDEAVLFGTLPAATVGTSYVYDLFLAGGDGSWSNPRAIVGVLPTWATLSIVGSPGAYKLRLSGTPTGSAATVSITVAVDSGDGQTASSAQSFAVSAAVIHVWNPSDKSSLITLSNSDTRAADSTTTTAWKAIRGVSSKSSGKWYFEVWGSNPGGGGAHGAGVATSSASLSGYPGSDAAGWAHLADGYKAHGGSYSAYGSSWSTTGLRVAVDLDAGKIWFGQNIGWDGDPAAGTGPAYTGVTGVLFPIGGVKLGDVITSRFDPASYLWTPPTGFLPWT